MTAEQYAARVAATVCATYADEDMTTAQTHLFDMAVRRAIGGEHEYALEPDVQAVEVKPIHDLVQDVREEAADQINYAVAIAERIPEAAPTARQIIRRAMETAGLCATLDAIVGEYER